ncbi:hypothetical protein [Streptomyces tritici]|uniref:hypothetical protein n=1 Tax=Streptomyces tritici TaxID=2054410 RepID=UPI003AF04F69
MHNAKIGTALIGGYVLGRTKKGKLALGLAMAMAGSRIKPGEIRGALARSPLLSNVNQQVRGELVGAGKAAATTVLNAKAERLADTLHQRTADLRNGSQEGAQEGSEEEAAPEKSDRPEGKREAPERKTQAPAKKVPRSSTSGTPKAPRTRSTRRHDDD